MKSTKKRNKKTNKKHEYKLVKTEREKKEDMKQLNNIKECNLDI